MDVGGCRCSRWKYAKARGRKYVEVVEGNGSGRSKRNFTEAGGSG